MPISVPNPYTGQEDQTCSVSFQAQQQMAAGVGSPQTEAQYNASKLKGEIGVMKAKVDLGIIPNGTKVLAFEGPSGTRGYYFVKGKQLKERSFGPDGKIFSKEASTSFASAEYLIDSGKYKVSIPQAVGPKVAAPTPATPVDPASTSVGSMSHEDVSAMFVKIKDDLAKEKGLNVKGANPALDQEVYKAIGNATGYTPKEVHDKVFAYKAAGNKLSALKKKVLAGTKQVPTGKPTQTPATGPKPLVPNAGTPKPDPKPNGVPTVATFTAANKAKQEVKQAAEANPGKVYSDEDISAAYIIAKDKIVAASNGKWTLYSKSDELDALIFGEVQAKTGLSKDKAQIAIANYLASGKKLSQLKKALAKQGAFKPQADTLKKSGAAKTQAEKDAEVAAKAAAGYTPTPTPAAGTPPVDTGKPMPKAAAAKAQESGDISDVSPFSKLVLSNKFKSLSSKTTPSALHQYQAVVGAVEWAKKEGHVDNDLTLLQAIRVIDEKDAVDKGEPNTHPLETKIASWLTTPAGTAYVKDLETKAAKENAAASVQTPLPADSNSFRELSLEEARALNEEWQRAKPWTAREKRDLKYYTGSAYTEINGYLRGLRSTASTRVKNAIAGARSGMRPTTKPLLVKRGTGLGQFRTIGGDSNVWGITGKTFKDEGFLSTSAGGRAAFTREALLEIECPVGTPMAYVAPISRYPSENEMLLQAGMEYKVLNVRKEGNTYVVRVRVVNWPGKAA